MIRNLNQVTFQGFGTVPPERAQNAGFDKNAASTWPLRADETVVYRAAADTWISFGTGSSVLSVSTDGTSFQDYYLDKPVCIRTGVYFALEPFAGEAAILLYSKEAPEEVARRPKGSLQVAHNLRVEAIYTFLYQEKEPLFERYRVDSRFSKALSRRVWLKSGGYLVIDHTEALTVIDVNTGKFVGSSSLAETILKINCEAAIEIARQLRLRDVGGIVIIAENIGGRFAAPVFSADNAAGVALLCRRAMR